MRVVNMCVTTQPGVTTVIADQASNSKLISLGVKVGIIARTVTSRVEGDGE